MLAAMGQNLRACSEVLQIAAKLLSKRVVVVAGVCICVIRNNVCQIGATGSQLDLGVRAGSCEGADMGGGRVAYRSERSGGWVRAGRLLEAPLVNIRAEVDECNPVYVLAIASAAILLGSGSGRFRQGSNDIQARKLHL